MKIIVIISIKISATFIIADFGMMNKILNQRVFHFHLFFEKLQVLDKGIHIGCIIDVNIISRRLLRIFDYIELFSNEGI